jgi:hypothetical protein
VHSHFRSTDPRYRWPDLLPAKLVPCSPAGDDQGPEDPSKHAGVVVQLESHGLFIAGVLIDCPHDACNVPAEVASACNAQDMQDDLCGGGFHMRSELSPKTRPGISGVS